MKKLPIMFEDEFFHHPDARLIDIYKLFMQSACGPGHLITDPATAREYLVKELAEQRLFLSKFPLYFPHPNIKRFKPQFVERTSSCVICPCLVFNCDAYFPLARYSLQIVNDGIIPMETFLNAFIETANNFTKIDEKRFSRHWQEIVRNLADREIPDFDADKQAIKKVMYNLVRHTPIYNELYHPSYRVINKTYLADYDQAINEFYRQ